LWYIFGRRSYSIQKGKKECKMLVIITEDKQLGPFIRIGIGMSLYLRQCPAIFLQKALEEAHSRKRKGFMAASLIKGELKKRPDKRNF